MGGRLTAGRRPPPSCGPRLNAPAAEPLPRAPRVVGGMKKWRDDATGDPPVKVWFPAALHLGHGNIIKYCQRPFLSAEEKRLAAADPRGKFRISQETVRRHDDALIDAINSQVDKADVLWVLGDFCWGRRNEAVEYRDRIVCDNVFLIWGNHDHLTVAPAFSAAYTDHMETVDGQDIWLYHYPLRTWNKRFHGAWHLYGHVHGRMA